MAMEGKKGSAVLVCIVYVCIYRYKNLCVFNYIFSSGLFKLSHLTVYRFINLPFSQRECKPLRELTKTYLCHF